MTFRLDRVGSLWLALPLVRCISEHGAGIPILMYHSIAEEDESQVHPYYRTATSPPSFASQMEYLHTAGYTACSPADARSIAGSSAMSVGKLVALTFDDGYQNVYREAFPVLQRFNFTASIFLSTAYIGNTTLEFKGRSCLNWSEVREMRKYGITFGSHTVTHRQLSSLSRSEVRRELVQSKRVIEQEISASVDSFAYPYAFPHADSAFLAMLQDLLQEVGYINGVCTIIGRVGPRSDPLFLPRLPVNDADDPDLFQAKLAGAYDWVGWAQRALKGIKSAVKTESHPH